MQKVIATVVGYIRDASPATDNYKIRIAGIELEVSVDVHYGDEGRRDYWIDTTDLTSFLTGLRITAEGIVSIQEEVDEAIERFDSRFPIIKINDAIREATRDAKNMTSLSEELMTGQIWKIKPEPEARCYTWTDFEEDESTDEIPGKYILTVLDPDGEEYVVIIHRTADGKFPLDGEVAQNKRDNAAYLVTALNKAEGLS